MFVSDSRFRVYIDIDTWVLVIQVSIIRINKLAKALKFRKLRVKQVWVELTPPPDHFLPQFMIHVSFICNPCQLNPKSMSTQSIIKVNIIYNPSQLNPKSMSTQSKKTFLASRSSRRGEIRVSCQLGAPPQAGHMSHCARWPTPFIFTRLTIIDGHGSSHSLSVIHSI